MFASLKLNSLKCQSNNETETKKDKCDYEEEGDDVSEHMYEKLHIANNNNNNINYNNNNNNNNNDNDNKSHPNTCSCRSNFHSATPKSPKNPLSKRISKWRMECPRITNLRVSRSVDEHESKNNQQERCRELFNSKLQTNLRTKVTTVNIQREDGSLGITLRGGFHQNSELSKPVTITYVKPDGPAAKEGTIKPGDRLLAVDGISLQGSTLSDAQTLLKHQSISTLLTIEYDVNILDSVEYANGPLLVEIERESAQELGLTLHQNEEGIIIIERVKPGSLSDRSGALHVGDEILAVNNNRIENSTATLEDVVQLLECDCLLLRLEILPTNAVVSYSNFGTWRNRGCILSPSSSISGISTLKSHVSRVNRDCEMNELSPEDEHKLNMINSLSYFGSNIALTHCETLHTTISGENGDFGLDFADSLNGVIISSVCPGGPAERSQCLHPGDRVLSVNHRSIALDNLTAKDVNEICIKSGDSKLNLHTEFDILDSVVPATGIFTVKLAKRGSSGLGITITASRNAGFMVCEMKKGSIAYRAGSLIPGDKLLAINNVPLDQCSIEYAAHILHQSMNVVTLKVQRSEHHPDVRNNRKVTYTVELQRYGGPLGITIAGSEEPFQPITVSGLTVGGLAEQTGVLHIGDEILAINNYSLYGEPLSKAHSLLQSSSDLVILKISRSIQPICRLPSNRSPMMPSSIDSAVESWDSSHLDLTPSPDHQKNGSESRDCLKRNPTVSSWAPSESNYAKSPSDENITSLNSTNTDLAILDEISSENLKIKQELDMLSIKLDEQCKANDEKTMDANGTEYEDSFQKPFEKLDIDLNILEATAQHMNGLETTSDSYSKVGTEGHTNPVDVDFVQEYSAGDTESFMASDLENFEMSFLPDGRNWYKHQYLNDSQGSIKSEFQSSEIYKVILHKDPVYEDFGFSVSDGLYERGVFINRIRKGGPADVSNVLKPYDRILQVNETYTQEFDCCLTVPLIASAGDSLVLLVARNTMSFASDNGIFESEKSHKKLVSQKLCLGENDQDEAQRIFV